MMTSIEMMAGLDPMIWQPAERLNGQPFVYTDGWEIVEVVEGLFQATVTTTRIKLCGQGHTPLEALEDAIRVMTEHRDDMSNHLENLHV